MIQCGLIWFNDAVQLVSIISSLHSSGAGRGSGSTWDSFSPFWLWVKTCPSYPKMAGSRMVLLPNMIAIACDPSPHGAFRSGAKKWPNWMPGSGTQQLWPQSGSKPWGFWERLLAISLMKWATKIFLQLKLNFKNQAAHLVVFIQIMVF